MNLRKLACQGGIGYSWIIVRLLGGIVWRRPIKYGNFLPNVATQSDSPFTTNQRPCRVPVSIQEVRRKWFRLAWLQCYVALYPACYRLVAREWNVQVNAMRNRKRQTIQNSYLRADPFFLSLWKKRDSRHANRWMDGQDGRLTTLCILFHTFKS